jgi:hypothetical protein
MMSRDRLKGILSGDAPMPEADRESEPESDTGDDSGDRDLKVDLAADVRDALESEDDAAFAETLGAFVRHCVADDYDDAGD